jgi:hypothetical protein
MARAARTERGIALADERNPQPQAGFISSPATRHPPPATRVLSGLTTRYDYVGIGSRAGVPAGLCDS